MKRACKMKPSLLASRRSTQKSPHLTPISARLWRSPRCLWRKTSLISALEKPSLPVDNRCLLRELCLTLPAHYSLSLPPCYPLPLSVVLSATPSLLRLLCYPLLLSAISLLYLQKQERPRSIQSTFSLNLQKTPNNKSGNKKPSKLRQGRTLVARRSLAENTSPLSGFFTQRCHLSENGRPGSPLATRPGSPLATLPRKN